MEILKKIENPYPPDIFTEPTTKEWRKLHKLLEKNRLMSERFFGSWGRRVWDNCIYTVMKRLNEELHEVNPCLNCGRLITTDERISSHGRIYDKCIYCADKGTEARKN